MPELEEMSVAELMAAAYDREVQFQIGKHYFNGTGGVEQDCFEGVEWIRSAAEREYAPAQNFLGRCYLHGRGVSKNASRAWRLFHKAADNGCIDALDYLALCRTAV